MAEAVIDPHAANKARLLDAIGNNPKYRPLVLEATKELFPHIPIPEVDARRSAAAVVEPLQQEIEKLRGELALRDASAETAAVRARHGLGDDEWKAVESLAVEKQIGNLDAAADYYRHTQRVATPRFAPTPITQPNMKGLWQDPVQWARAEAYNVLNEMAQTGIRHR